MSIVIAATVATAAGCSSTPQKQSKTPTQGQTAATQSQSASAASGDAQKPITVGVSFRTERQGRWAFELREIQKHAQQLGVKVITQEANENPSLQANQVENMITKGVNAIILGAVDAGAGKQLVDDAHKANIPIIAYDTPIDDANLSYLVIRNDIAVGEMQAQQALQFSSGGDWAIIKGDPSAGVARTISQGYDKVLTQPIADHKINVVYNQYTAQWSTEKAQSVAENLVTRYGDKIKVWLTSSDGLATGVAQVLKENHLSGKVFVSGLDSQASNLTLIAQGEQTMTVWAHNLTWADTALDIATDLAEGKTPSTTPANGVTFTKTPVTGGSVPTALIGIEAITRSNLCDFVTKQAPAGWAGKNTVFASDPSACP